MGHEMRDSFLGLRARLKAFRHLLRGHEMDWFSQWEAFPEYGFQVTNLTCETCSICFWSIKKTLK